MFAFALPTFSRAQRVGIAAAASIFTLGGMVLSSRLAKNLLLHPDNASKIEFTPDMTMSLLRIIIILQHFAFGSRSAAAAEKQPAALLDPAAFKKFTIASVTDVSHNTKIFRLALPEGRSLELPISSCVVAKAQVDGKDVFRPYTPISSNLAKGYFELMIKTYPQGILSKHFHSLKAGDAVELKGPIAKIAVTPNLKRRLGMVAGGTGIAPMLQVINAIVEDAADQTEVSLVFANATPEDILLKSTLDTLAARYPAKLKVHYVIEAASDSVTPGKGADANVSLGRVSPQLLSKLMPAPSADSMVFVCGPPPMMEAVSGSKAKDYSQGEVGGMLAGLGYKKDQVFKF